MSWTDYATIGLKVNLIDPCSPGDVKSADTNDDGKIDLSDAVALLNHLFLGALPPPPPFPDCGTDGTEDGLSCESSGPCA